jgi:DNA-binding NtrC family response regulator
VDDDELIVSMLARALTRDGYQVEVETDPAGVVEKIRSFRPDVVLLDIKLPGRSGLELLPEIVAPGIARQVVMLTSDDTAETAVKAMKLGAVDYLTKPFNLDEVKIVVSRVVEKGDLRHEVDYLRKISAELTDRPIIGESPVIAELQEQAAKLAAAAVPVILITGESGTGKEVFARYIHQIRHDASSSRPAPFIGINCAALPESLIESELFGHEKGSFTDAKTDKKGVFEMAYGGSILLDEIGEMKSSLQSKLLRVLEERMVRRVGGHRDIPIDAAVFATTNRDLERAVEQGEFRQDLFFRLNAFSLYIPPLRERQGDIIDLARYFLRQFSTKYKRMTLKGFSPEVEELLRSHGWPGNVREVRNVVERIVVLESGDTILPEHLPKEFLEKKTASARSGGAGISLPDSGLSLDEVERSLIVQALEKAGGNKTRAAKLLDMTYDSLRYQIKKFGLE